MAPIMEFQFTPELAPYQSKREQELEIARRRSHSARVSHPKKRQNVLFPSASRSTATQVPPSKKNHSLVRQAPERAKKDDKEDEETTDSRPKAVSKTNPAVKPPKQSLRFFRGSSDPFNTQAVPITPNINLVIHFVRDYLFPALYCTPFMSRLQLKSLSGPLPSNFMLGQAESNRNWKELSEGLSNEGGASAWLSGYIPMLLPFVPDHERDAFEHLVVKLRARSLHLLQEYVKNISTAKDPDHSFTLYVLWIFRSELMAGNFEAARVHLKILMDIGSRSGDKAERRHLLLKMMFLDIESAMPRMRKTLLDFDGWVWRRVSFYCEEAGQRLKLMTSKHYNVHPNVQPLSIRASLARLRSYVDMTKQQLVVGESVANVLEYRELIYAWIVIYSLYDNGSLLNQHLDLVQGNCAPSLTPGERYTEASLALATAYAHRKCIHLAVVNGRNIRDCSHVIMPQLESSMKFAFTDSTADELIHFQYAHLWILYLGAQYEQRTTKAFSKQTQPVVQWFSKLFLFQASFLKLKTWEDVEDALDQFVMYDFVASDLKSWFELSSRMKTRPSASTGAAQRSSSSEEPQFQEINKKLYPDPPTLVSDPDQK